MGELQNIFYIFNIAQLLKLKASIKFIGFVGNAP